MSRIARLAGYPALALGGLLLALLIVSPQLQSGYYWDDNVLSTTLGATRETGLSLPALMAAGARAIFETQGRFFPLSAVALVPLYSFDRFTYKVSILVLVALNLVLFAFLLRRLDGSWRSGALFLAVVPLSLQFRFGPDAILGYHWILQLVSLHVIASLLCFLGYLRHGKPGALAAAICFYACAVLTYEIAYVLFVLHLILAVTGPRQSAGAMKAALAFPGTVAAVVALTWLLRLGAGMPLYGNNSAYIPHADFSAVALTTLRQASAALPAGFVLLSGLREIEKLSVPEVAAGIATGFSWAHACAFVLGAGLVAAWARRWDAAEGLASPAIGWLGSALWVLPAALIALSPKYQQRNWIDWGMGYLPVYLSAFGVAAMLVWWLERAGARRAGRPAVLPIERVIAVSAALGLGAAATFVYEANAQVVRGLDARFRIPREVAEDALRHGLFEDVPPGAFLLVGSEAFPGPNPAFYRTHRDVPLRKVAGKGYYLGSAAKDETYFASLFQACNLRDVALAARGKYVPATGVRNVALEPVDAVYYFRFEAGPAFGYAILGSLSTLRASENEIRSAESANFAVYVKGKPPDPLLLDARDGAGRRVRLVLPPGAVRKAGRGWRLYRPDVAGCIDLVAARLVP